VTFVNLRGVWFLTALAVVGLCAVAVSRGWDIARFSAANAYVSDDDNQAQAVRPWIAASGLSFSARESSLTAIADPQDEDNLRIRRDEQTGILSVRPLSSKYWLMLSEMRLLTKEPISKAVEAFELAELTGSHEGYLMFPRGVYGVVHWEILPPELQRKVATDLVATTTPLTDGQKASLQKALSKKTEPVRQDVKTLLQAQGFSAKNLAAIGL
jgi:hypothetical protein